MPAEGIDYLPKHALLSYEEMARLVSVSASMGITKIRLTGGEPFVRNDLLKLIEEISRTPGVREWHITTNGVLTEPYIPQLKAYGVKSVNLSLDTLDKARFKKITLRDEFDRCFSTLHALIRHGIPVKINAVVMDGKNTDDLLSLVELTRDNNISVRFIEEMPFNGTGRQITLQWSYKKILEHLSVHYPDIEKLHDEPHGTALNYKVPSYRGTVGIIPAFSRTFCGTCNRIRVTAQGMLKTCLYAEPVLDIKQLIRGGASNEEIREALMKTFAHRFATGSEAEASRKRFSTPHESMSTIGG